MEHEVRRGSTIDIRRGTAADAEAISALVLDLAAPFFVSPTRDGAEAFLASIAPSAERDRLVAPNFAVRVAEAEGRLAGVVALRDGGHLFHLFVAPAHQRRGLARRLWEIVRAEAIAGGQAGGFTVNSSLPAVPVDERFGFVRVGGVREMHGVAFQPMRQPAGPRAQ